MFKMLKKVRTSQKIRRQWIKLFKKEILKKYFLSSSNLIWGFWWQPLRAESWLTVEEIQ